MRKKRRNLQKREQKKKRPGRWLKKKNEWVNWTKATSCFKKMFALFFVLLRSRYNEKRVVKGEGGPKSRFTITRMAISRFTQNKIDGLIPRMTFTRGRSLVTQFTTRRMTISHGHSLVMQFTTRSLVFKRLLDNFLEGRKNHGLQSHFTKKKKQSPRYLT